MKLRAIDICCGAGGWACASRGLPIEWVAVADWAEDSLETWKINHRDAHPDCNLVCEDLSSWAGMQKVLDAAGHIDLVCGAIPCEQLSVARANRALKPGELEGCYSLIDTCFEMIRRVSPTYWVFEDVTAVEHHIPPPLIADMAYECRRINSKQFGPQARIRTFFGQFPQLAEPEQGPRTLGEIMRPGPHRTLSNLQKYERSKSRWYGGNKVRVQDPKKPGATVLSSQGGKGSRAERSGMVPVVRTLDVNQASPAVLNYSSRHERAALIPVRKPFAQKRLLDPANPAPTITKSCAHREIMDGMEQEMIRVIEWQEAALLQGFPTDYIFAASWSRTWKLIAQAIPVYVGRAILKGVVASVEARKEVKPAVV